MRLAVDTGGTFTDLVLEDESGVIRIFKTSSTPDDPLRAVTTVLDLAAAELGIDRRSLLERAEFFVHGSTQATNALLTGSTARTAFLTTAGHPDILLFREGGRSEPFNYAREYPDPYVPRSLTFEIPERIDGSGEVVKPLKEARVIEILAELAARQVEAIGVCFLWSIANPAHELRVGELIEEHLPRIPYTLSHRLNPALREYRRASSAVIDASLKPLMTEYLSRLERWLRECRFRGRALAVTAGGGVIEAGAVAEAPIHSIGSGPAMAPIAGRFYARRDGGTDTAIVADTGGTSYDVSLVRNGRIPWTRETWLGGRYVGHMTGFPSVDVKSIGAGGGSIAWVDEGGLLHVGPESAGAEPGPICYGRGGRRPTVTDAALVLGYLDANYFLGGELPLDVESPARGIERDVATPLGLEYQDAAAAILELASEHMVQAIEEITLNQGIDPRSAVLIGGGGAAGLNAIVIARRLGCSKVIIPATGAVLSATGALMSDLVCDFRGVRWTTTSTFDFDEVNDVLRLLRLRAEKFLAEAEAPSLARTVEFSAEARYPQQVWELEVPFRGSAFATEADVEQLRQDFHALHANLFAISDPDSPVEVVAWNARALCSLRRPDIGSVRPSTRRSASGGDQRRFCYYPSHGVVETEVLMWEEMNLSEAHGGPVIIESPFTTVVVDPEGAVTLAPGGSLVLWPNGVDARLASVERGVLV